MKTGAMRTNCAAWCAAAVSLLAPVAADAATPPAPGCLGMNFEDPAGDPREAGSGFDVTGGFLTLRDGTPVVNVRLADLDLAAYPQPDDLYKTIRVLYTVGGSRFVVQATFNRLGSQSYSSGNGTRPSKRSSGRAHAGPDGVVEMDLPDARAGAAVSIGEIRTESYKFAGVEYEPDENMLRRTMDLAQGATQTLACPAAASVPASSAPQPAATPPPGGDEPASTAPSVQGRPVVAVTLRARRVRGARVRLTGRASGVRDGARVVLLRGRRVVARTVVRNGRFSVLTRRAPRGASVRAQVAGRTSAVVRIG